jgi:thioredoxin 1
MTFEAHINGTKPVVVDFFATWCGPCKMMEPVLKQLKSRVGEKATILKMDIDKNPSYANLYGIQAVPTVIIFKDGKIIWRKSGVANVNELLQQTTQFLT